MHSCFDADFARLDHYAVTGTADDPDTIEIDCPALYRIIQNPRHRRSIAILSNTKFGRVMGPRDTCRLAIRLSCVSHEAVFGPSIDFPISSILNNSFG